MIKGKTGAALKSGKNYIILKAISIKATEIGLLFALQARPNPTALPPLSSFLSFSPLSPFFLSFFLFSFFFLSIGVAEINCARQVLERVIFTPRYCPFIVIYPRGDESQLLEKGSNGRMRYIRFLQYLMNILIFKILPRFLFFFQFPNPLIKNGVTIMKIIKNA